MNENLAAWVAGYRLGHDGLPPALSVTTVLQELADIEASPPPSGNVEDHYWLWHLMGWTVGQAIAQHQIGRP